MAALKLITLNMEGDRHLERVLPFLKKESPEVLCLQEVFQSDFEDIKRSFGYQGLFRPMYLKTALRGGVEEPQGVAIMSVLNFTHTDYHYYRGGEENTTSFEKPGTYQYVCLKAGFVYEGKAYTVASTHFTWTPDGNSNREQFEDLGKLLSWLGREELILCGDFNAPRGDGVHDGLIHARLAEVYTDNIPLGVVSTLDEQFHRKSDLNLVVDHIWSTPKYKVQNLQVVKGLSDHCALVAEILKVA